MKDDIMTGKDLYDIWRAYFEKEHFTGIDTYEGLSSPDQGAWDRLAKILNVSSYWPCQICGALNRLDSSECYNCRNNL